MKILFLCGSLEPGRDGVGDYTRRLGGELIRQGHKVVVIALFDKFLRKVCWEDQYSGESILKVLRVPYYFPMKRRFYEARSAIEHFSPDVLSLQFVIFSFHRKGLPFFVPNFLKNIGRKYKWHIMFHELYVGVAKNEMIKFRVLGFIQKCIIKSMIRKLKPEVVHTQCSLFLSELTRLNVQVGRLGLFSNIEASGKNVSVDYQQDANVKSFIFFGGLHPHSKILDLIDRVKKLELTLGISFRFIYVGRNGNDLQNHLKILDKHGLQYRVYGELESDDISELLFQSTIGVSTGSPQMIDKNGTVAAMLAHSLPVVCIGRDLVMNKFPMDSLNGVFFLDDLERAILNPPLVFSSNSVSDIASRFISDL